VIVPVIPDPRLGETAVSTEVKRTVWSETELVLSDTRVSVVDAAVIVRLASVGFTADAAKLPPPVGVYVAVIAAVVGSRAAELTEQVAVAVLATVEATTAMVLVPPMQVTVVNTTVPVGAPPPLVAVTVATSATA